MSEKMLAFAVAGSAVAAVAVAAALGVPVQKILQDAVGGVLSIG
jgi:NADH:ubiquinone oxidoreductase subunit F (NADH-binding)